VAVLTQADLLTAAALAAERQYNEQHRQQQQQQQMPPPKKQRLLLPAQDPASKPPSQPATNQQQQQAPPQNRRPASKKKQPVVVDSRPSVQLFLDIKNPVNQPVHISRHPTHTAPQFKILDSSAADGKELTEDEMARLSPGPLQFIVYNERGYRMCKASHGVSTGRWYFECTILPPQTLTGNLRIGWSQISGDLQAPCGYDAFSYSYRARPPSRFHHSRPADYGVDYLEPGTVLGCLIDLPSAQSSAGDQQILRDIDGQPCDPLPAEWNGEDRYNTVPYFGNRPICRGSQIRFFVDGQDQDVAFADIYAGKYYPAVSSYFGGRVSVNFGQHPFQCGGQPPMNSRPMSECFEAVSAAVPESGENFSSVTK
jgi:hypothetical protein